MKRKRCCASLAPHSRTAAATLRLVAAPAVHPRVVLSGGDTFVALGLHSSCDSILLSMTVRSVPMRISRISFLVRASSK